MEKIFKHYSHILDELIDNYNFFNYNIQVPMRVKVKMTGFNPCFLPKCYIKSGNVTEKLQVLQLYYNT